jgi:sterol desaturase/sphingolipid hydroxylase (fatty acid hydroxylase superfamily)
MNVHALYRGNLARPAPALLSQALGVALLWAMLAVRAGPTSLGSSLGASVLWLGAGLLAWTLFEYALHRWLMHSRNPALWRLLHQEHHAVRGMDIPEHRVLHPAVSVPVFVGLLWLVHEVLGGPPAAALGFWAGYLAYEALHWLHHDTALSEALDGVPWLRRRLAHHEGHHFRHARSNYGVLTSAWDRLLGTYRAPPPRPTRP